MWLVLAIAVVAVGVFVLGIAFWSRRGEHLADVPGTRTLCCFAGGHAYATAAERAAEAQMGTIVLGEGIVTALALAVQKLGVVTTEPDADDQGWAFHASHDGASSYVQAWCTPDEPERWVLLVQDPSGGGPGARALLPVIDQALRNLPGISAIQWHAREELLANTWQAGRDSPTDDG